MESKAQAIVRFIFALIIVGGVTTGLIWANCSDKVANTQQSKSPDEECAGGPAKIEHDSLVEWASDESYPAKGDTVTFEGYVDMPALTFVNNGWYMVNLRSDSTLEGRKVTMQILEGDCENTMLPLPNDFDLDDLVIHDNDGKKVKQGEKIRATGIVNGQKGLYMFYIKRIEKM